MFVQAVLQEASKTGPKWAISDKSRVFKIYCREKKGKEMDVYEWEFPGRGHWIDLAFEGAFLFRSTDPNIGVIKGWGIRPTKRSLLKYDPKNDRDAQFEEDNLTIALCFESHSDREFFIRLCKVGWRLRPTPL